MPTALLTTDRLTADEPGKTDATLTNTSLSFAVTSGVYYRFRFTVLWRTTSAIHGLKLGLTTPAFTVFGATVRHIIGADGAGAELQGALTTSGGAVTGTNAPVVTTDYVSTIEGVILPSASGTLMLQYAAEATGATVTLRQGSAAELIEEAPAAVAVAIRSRTVLQAVQRATY